LVYDVDRVRRAGLDPESPPTSLDELRHAVEQMVTTDAAATGLALYDTATSWLIDQRAARSGSVLAEPDNGTLGGVVDRFVFDTPENRAALRWLQQMHADGLVAWFGLNASSFDNLVALVGPEPAAMTLHTSGALGDVLSLVEAGPWGDVTMGVAPLPGPGVGGLVGGGGLWLLDRADPARHGASWEVVEALLKAEALAAFVGATGYVPVRASVLEEPLLLEVWERRPQLRVAYDQLAATSVSPATMGLQVGPRPQIQRVLEIAASLMVTGEVDAGDELRGAEDVAMELMVRYGSS
jgi:sn-glycerol 3-phosphate transport system substrate-binding protein